MKTNRRKPIRSGSDPENHVYKLIELTGSSASSMEDAVNVALKRASASIRNLRWFQVREVRGNIERDRVSHWQVTLKAGFTVEE